MSKTEENEAMLYQHQHKYTPDTQQTSFSPQNQPGVVYVQPGAPVTVVVGNVGLSDPPPDYIAYAIIVTLCCCWPIGIFAILKSLACRDATRRGDRDRATRYSRDAKKLGHFTLGVGIFFQILMVIVVIAAYAFWLIPAYRQAKAEQADYSGYDR